MEWISALLGGGAKSVLEGVGGLAKDIRESIVGSEISSEKKAELALQLQAIESVTIKTAAEFDIAQMQGQVDLNKIEAGSDSILKSGWRPMVGWVCVFGLSYTFVLKPLLPWILQVGALIFDRVSTVPPLPEIPMGDLIVLLGGLLGLGTMRTVEKLQGRK